MKIALVNPPLPAHAPVARDMAGGLGFDAGQTMRLPPLDLLYYAASLQGAGHTVSVLDAGVTGLSPEDALRRVAADEPQAVIGAVSLPSVRADCDFLRRLRHDVPRARILAKTAIAHGPLVKDILSASGAQVCLVGECELEIGRIIAGESDRGTARLVSGDLVRGERLVIEDLDALPLPARELVPNERYSYPLLGDAVATMQTSRGCPFSCGYYCPYPLVQGNTWRARSPNHLIAEVADIVTNHGIRRVLMRDATFTYSRERVAAFCGLLRQRRIDLEWWCETRVDCLNADVVRMMSEAGCRGMNIGIETGDPELMRSEAKAGLTPAKVEAIVAAADAVGMKLHMLFMIGLPGESRQSLLRTAEFMARMRFPSVGICAATPYPGTPLFEEAERKGWIESREWSEYDGHGVVMHTDRLTSAELRYAAQALNSAAVLARGGVRSRVRLAAFMHRLKRWAAGHEIEERHDQTIGHHSHA